MKKRRKKSILFGLLLLIGLLLPRGGTALAEEEEQFFAYLGEGEEFLVNIEWESTQPVVRFRSPSGELYDVAEEREGTHVSVGQTQLYYYIEQAEAGSWYVIYDKRDNASIGITLEQAGAPLVVTVSEVPQPNSQIVTVSFQADYPEELLCRYRVNVLAGDSGTGMEVANGLTYTNRSCEVNVDLSEIGTSDRLRFYVYVWFQKNGVDIGEGAYSEPFFYCNPEQGEVETPFLVTVRPEENRITVSWVPAYRTKYLVSLFENSDREPVAYGEITGFETTSYDFNYSTDATRLEIRIAEKPSYQSYSREKSVVCELDRLPQITFEDREITNRSFLLLTYENVEVGSSAVLCSNEDTCELVFTTDTKGTLQVELLQELNEVSFAYRLADDLQIVYEKEVEKDVLPPRIYMLQDYTRVRTSETDYVVAGTVTEATEVRIGKEPVELAADGSFSYTLSLKEGSNEFVVEATDAAGNTAMYVISAECTATGLTAGEAIETGADPAAGKAAGKGILRFLPMIAAAVFGIGVLLLAMLSGKKERAGVLANLRSLCFGLAGLGALGSAYSGYAFITGRREINSTKFLEQAYRQMNAAAERIRETEQWKQIFLIFLAVTGGFLVLGGLLAVAKRLVVRRQEKKQAENADAKLKAEKEQEPTQSEK